MTDSTGKAQGLAIDNLSFSASVPLPVPLTVQTSGANLILSWPSITGQTYQLECKDDLYAPTWTPLGSPINGNGGTLSATNSIGAPASDTSVFDSLIESATITHVLDGERPSSRNTFKMNQLIEFYP